MKVEQHFLIIKISKQMLHQSKTKKQYGLQHLLTLISNRQADLFLVFNQFSFSQSPENEFKICKTQFFQRENFYEAQITKIINNLNKQVDENFQKWCRTFWMKAKKILKVSLEKAINFEFFNETILAHFENIFRVIEDSFEEGKALSEFYYLYLLIQKRNFQLFALAQQFFRIKHPRKAQKANSLNCFRSQILRKQPKNVCQKIGGVSMKMKSFYRYPTKKVVISEKISVQKKRNFHQIRLNKFMDIMDCTLQADWDVKKGKRQNSQILYEHLFNKNIPQHKVISKYLFTVYGTENQKSKSREKSKPKRPETVQLKARQTLSGKGKRKILVSGKMIKFFKLF